MDETPIKLRFGYTLSDRIHAYRFYHSKSRRNTIEKIAGAAFTVIGCILLAAHYDPVSRSFIIGTDWEFFVLQVLFVLAGIAIWFDLASLLRIWFDFRRSVSFPPKPYDFAFSDSGAEFSLENDTGANQVEVKLSWTEFKRILEDQTMILLVTKEDKYWTIPKRSFSNPEDLSHFQHLLKNKFQN